MARSDEELLVAAVTGQLNFNLDNSEGECRMLCMLQAERMLFTIREWLGWVRSLDKYGCDNYGNTLSTQALSGSTTLPDGTESKEVPSSQVEAVLRARDVLYSMLEEYEVNLEVLGG